MYDLINSNRGFYQKSVESHWRVAKNAQRESCGELRLAKCNAVRIIPWLTSTCASMCRL